MKPCPNCNHPVEPGVALCPHCGRAQASSAAPGYKLLTGYQGADILLGILFVLAAPIAMVCFLPPYTAFLLVGWLVLSLGFYFAARRTYGAFATGLRGALGAIATLLGVTLLVVLGLIAICAGFQMFH